MTQQQRIMAALEAAGERGVRSDVFIKDLMPRAAARVEELNDQLRPDREITSVSEGKFCRYTLIEPDQAIAGGDKPTVACGPPEEPAPSLFELPKRPNFMDYDADAAA